MAKPPQPVDDLVTAYGPHLNYAPPGGWDAAPGRPADRLVKTHCSFCGMQCGIQLKVRDEKVVGFEPWEEFPFNRGMLCPKGVKRYLQGDHPDRLLTNLVRTGQGFAPTSYEAALDLTARRIREIQAAHGPDAVAIYGGASMISEKAYILGKFARVAVGTRHIDYNGRLCMVSAGTAYKLTFGIDRATNPWPDLAKAEVVLIAGSNTAECAPITTHYLWQCREHGGRLIVVDPRMTPITRNADLYLPVRPGTDLALFLGMLHVIVRDGLVRDDFIARQTTGFDELRASVQDWTLDRAARVTGVPPANIEKAAHWIGESDHAMGLHARGIEHQSKGVENCLAMVNLFLATGNVGREGAGCMMITGQGNGQGGREHGQKADQLPGDAGHHRSRGAALHRLGVERGGGLDPGPGAVGRRDHGSHPSRRDQGAVLDVLQPAGVAARRAVHPRGARQAGVLRRHRLLPLRDRAPRRRRLRRQPAGGRRRHRLQRRGAGPEDQQGGGPAGRREVGRADHLRPGAQAREGASTSITRPGRGSIYDELRLASKGGLADYYGITWERIERELGVFWPCPELDHPGTPRLFEDGRFYHKDGKAHFQVTPWRDSGDPVGPEFPVFLTTGRVVSHYLSGTQTRRIGPLVDQYPEPRVEIHPRLAEAHGIGENDWVRVTTRRGAIVLQASVVRTIRPDTVFIPYHWPGKRSANVLTHRTLDPRSKIPEFKVSACRLEKAAAPADLETIRRDETGWTAEARAAARAREDA